MKLIHNRALVADLKPGKSAGAYSEQSADVLAGILESTDELFAAIDADLRFVAFNATFRQIFTSAFRQPPMLGQALPDALAEFPEQQAMVSELARRVFGGEALRVDQELSIPGMPPKVFEVNLTPVRSAGGKTVVVALVAVDITEKREAELKFRRLVEASPDAMVIVRGGVIEHLNHLAETMFGYPPGALQGRPLEILVPERLRQKHQRDRADYAAAPKTRPMGVGVNLAGVRADGSEFPVEISLSPLSGTGDTLVAAAIRDVSARRRTEDELRQRVAELEARLAEVTHGRTHAEARQQSRERALGQEAEQYQAAFEQAATGIVITTPDTRIVKANDSFCRMLGYSDAELVQRRLHEITHPEDIAVGVRLDVNVLARAPLSYSTEKRFYRQDGSLMWGALAASIKRDAAGKPQYFVVIVEDVTRRRLRDEKIAETQVRLQLAVEIARLGFWEWTPATNETYYSPEWRQQLGLGERRLPVSYEEWQSWLHPDDRERVLQTMRSYISRPRGEYEIEYRMRHSDGSYRWFSSRGIAIESPSGKALKIIGIRLDISDRKEIEQRIRHSCQHDPLTGLPNRALLFEYAEHIFANAQRNGSLMAVLFLDLDRFKEINDTHGHETGDTVLREAADRLRNSIRRGDVAGRLGGDEFLVILPEISGEASAASVAEHVLVQLNKPYRVGSRKLDLSLSIGIALFPSHGSDLDALIRQADHAMYRAKEAGGSGIRFFTAGQESGKPVPENAADADQQA